MLESDDESRRWNSGRNALFLAAALCVPLLIQLLANISESLLWLVASPGRWSRWIWISINAIMLGGLIYAQFSVATRSNSRRGRMLGNRNAILRIRDETDQFDAELNGREQRDAEWARRAKNRLPFT
jgi:hypothetical protein